MGQTSSSSFYHQKPKLSLTWVLRNNTQSSKTVPTPEPPIKFQYSKTRRKSRQDDDTKKETILSRLVTKRVGGVAGDEQQKCEIKKTNLIKKQTIKNSDELYDVEYIKTKTVGDPNQITKTSELLNKINNSTKENKYNNIYTTDPSKLLILNKQKLNNKNHKKETKEHHGAGGGALKKDIKELDAFPLKKRTSSEPTLVHNQLNSDGERVKQRHKRRSRSRAEKRTTSVGPSNHQKINRFGYDIEDIDSFLAKV